MEGTLGQRDARERPRQPPYPRASSRASTATSSTANTQTTPRSANSSSSYLPPSTRPNGQNHSHKFHHSQCGTGSYSRPASRLSRADNEDTRSAAAPITSSFLQERLQKERKAEVERSSSRMSGDLSASTGDIRDRDVQSSPVRRSATAMGRRPRSNSGDEASQKNGMGAKETDQAMSTLHKQNFDLKLELFHRRERQTMLEEKNEKLQTQHDEMMEIHESLVAELEKRDKAVGEAVAMILKLEERVDGLLREREMVRQVEADGSYRHSRSNSGATPTATNRGLGAAFLDDDDDRILGRMPSFLSEQSEHTKNLRNVVLKNKSSMLHMRNVSGSSADPSEINRIASPSLSVLSESSFTSVYGAKPSHQEPLASTPQTDLPEFSDDTIAGSPTPSGKPSKGSRGEHTSNCTPTKLTRTPSKGGASLASQMQSLGDILDMTSPLQELVMLERKLSVAEKTSQPPIPSRGNGVTTPSPAKTSRNQSQVRTKQEKREALRKVLTTSPPNEDFGNPHVLPPTPDTISTSTLRRFHQNSNDTLSRDVRLTPRESSSFLNENPTGSTTDAANKPSLHHTNSTPSQPASTTAFTSRKHMPFSNLDAELLARFSHLAQSPSIPRRPRSACETTSSRARADSWASDSDSEDGGADAHSDDSNFDYWMRESSKPESSSVKRDANRKQSPDLFSFPETSGGWETDALFGAMRGNGFLGSPVSELKRDPLDMATAGPPTSRSTAFDATARSMSMADGLDGPVMPPNRRSSLHARTGSVNVSAGTPPPAVSGGKLRKSPNRPQGTGVGRIMGRARSNSIDSATAAAGPKSKPSTLQIHTQLDGQFPGAGVPVSKRSQYPPISGHVQPNRGSRLGSFGGLGGLNGLFRRDRTGSDSVPNSATEPTFPAAQTPQLHRVSRDIGRSSVPPPAMSPWMRPTGVMEHELGSATPPPIMRKRGTAPALQGADGELDGPVTPQNQQYAELGVYTSVSANTTPNGVQSGGKRKWLAGLGRRNSLKKNAA